ncbi:MAG: SPOR domain-containing protein [Allosphingosinicella sp.]
MRNGKRRLWVLTVAAATMLAVPGSAPAQNVEAGVRAWQAGQYEEAARNWRPLADRGDQDAQFNLGHAYRLGRGVPRNMTLAEQWYERAARSGHVEAPAMYGLILFQNGRRREAMPFVQRAAEHGDARAQYVYGTALFNGDVVERDWPRAFAYMTVAAGQGLPYAQSQLREMEQHIGEADRDRGTQLAATLARQEAPATAPTRIATADPLPGPGTPPAPRPSPPTSRVQGTAVPPSTATGTAMAERTPVPVPPTRPGAAPAAPVTPTARPAPAPTPAAAAGRWRVQLGAFSSEANARRAWSAVAGRVPNLQPSFVRAGNLVRLQVGPLGSRAAAERTCAALSGQACFPVAP